MRKRLLLSALAMLTLLGFSDAFALSGGPDAFGYTWRDSNEPNGPTYVWNDISTNSNAVQIAGLADDNAVGPFALNGWDFRYYWTDVDEWKFGSNGWVGFNNIGNISHCFPVLPTQGGAGDHFIAPFMTDLNYASSFPASPNPGTAWYYDNGVDSLTIQWNDVPWWFNGTPDWVGSNTFQMIITSTDSSIVFMYNDMDPGNFNDTPGCAADCEIGMENITGNIGLEVFNETIPADQYAVKFYFPTNITFMVPDAQPSWNANADNAGGFYLAGATASPVDMITNVANVGNADITNAITVSGELRDRQLTVLWTDNSTLASLNAGDDSTMTFPNQVTFTNPNLYSYKVTTSNSQDINPSNNENVVEIVAVECQNDTMNLTYSAEQPPDGVLIWTGGQNNEGGAIYIVPPVYPVTIEAVDVFIADIDQNVGVVDGYSIAIYDDTGLPGAILDSVGVASANVTENVWNRVTMNGTATINSGGFYVAWYQGGANVALGTETLAPISQRTFEILSGTWAPYRLSTVDDFQIRAHTSTVCPLVGVADANEARITLQANPNPANGLTAIAYELPEIGDVRLTVSNMFGQTLFAKEDVGMSAGSHSFNYDTDALSSGVYFINLEFGNEKVTKKLVVNR